MNKLEKMVEELIALNEQSEKNLSALEYNPDCFDQKLYHSQIEIEQLLKKLQKHLNGKKLVSIKKPRKRCDKCKVFIPIAKSYNEIHAKQTIKYICKQCWSDRDFFLIYDW